MKINWRKLIEECPTAFEKWHKHSGIVLNIEWVKTTLCLPDKIGASEFDFGYYQRELYDFFDESKVFIDIDHDFGEDWTFCIDLHGTGHSGDDVVFKSRKEAEISAFTKAFELLESQLTNNGTNLDINSQLNK